MRRIVAVLVGALFLWHNLNTFAKYGPLMRGALLTNPTSLRTTRGTIVSSRLNEVREGKRGTFYNYAIVYQYTVAGHVYSSDRVTFSCFVGERTPGFALGYTTKYPPGRAVVTYYDPDQPNFAVLEPRSTEGTLFEALKAALGVCLCIAAIIWGLLGLVKKAQPFSQGT